MTSASCYGAIGSKADAGQLSRSLVSTHLVWDMVLLLLRTTNGV